MRKDEQFKITIIGDPKSAGDYERLKGRSHIKIIKVDQGAKLEITHFARLTYKLIWTGKINNWYALTIAQKAISEYTKRYFNKWSYSIKINLLESGK